MKKTSISCMCIIALVALAVWAPKLEAYENYSAQKDANDNPTGNCVSCHGVFDAANYISRNDETPWFTSLHVGHRAGMLSRDCDTCHIGDFTTRYPVSLNASNGGTGFEPISCVGCHGRDGDLNNGQIGAGLRQHHVNSPNFTGFCGGCHSDNTPAFTPVGESAAPSYYFTPDAAHPDKPTDPCNANAELIGQESVFGPTGLDNDGDLLYDGDDPDCQPCESDADCDNGVFCDGAETCNANGTCQPGTPPDCDDGVVCTDDACDPTLDECVNTPNDASCDDNNVCNGSETCDLIAGCMPGADLDCDDGNLCTTDSCDPLTGCANVPVECPAGQQCDSADGVCKPEPECTVDADCDNGFFCDGTETCDTATGTCQAGTDVDCDDGVVCTVDTCDETNDACVNTPDDASCDDGNVCNGTETCDPVNDCQPGTALDCDDGNLCTTDSCDPLTGCANAPVECPAGEQCDPADGECKPEAECTVDADCDNGFFCDGTETCDTATGTCQAGTAPDCDDGVVCTADTCDETNDACVNTPDDASCDDGDVCNGVETCDPVNDCQPGTALDCDDGELCTTDTCDPLTGCGNVPVECPAGEQCDSADGVCKPEPECTVDADCDNGFFCDGTETCDTATGTCQAGTPPDCDDGVDCTVDTCDEVNDTCANTPDDAACPDDGLFCTGDEICDPAAGCVSTGDPCPEGTTCNEDTDTCDVVSEKVTICHKGKNTITVSAGAVAAHLRHGDTLGPCP